MVFIFMNLPGGTFLASVWSKSIMETLERTTMFASIVNSQWHMNVPSDEERDLAKTWDRQACVMT